MKSVTQFLWRDCLNMPDYPPEKPVEAAGECWLCGCDLGAAPWPLKNAFAQTFTDFPSAKRNDSAYVCCACVATSKSNAYAMVAQKHGFPEFFPLKEGKTPRALNWVYMSHVFNSAGFYAQPTRPEWRELLLSPPEPPFAMILAVNGKKHVIFRAAINYSRDVFSVQADEMRIYVDRSHFVELLEIVEIGYATGFSKQSMLDGNYNQAAVMKVGISVWKDIDARLKPWRLHHSGMLFLATYCCVRDN